MTRRSKVGLSVSVAVVLLIVAWSLSGTAQRQTAAGSQSAAPVRIAVTITHVKPDMVSLYEDAVKNTANPALKKAGVVYRWMWSSFLAGQNYRYVSAMPVSNLA